MLDSQRDSYPFTLSGEFNINDGEPFQVNRFHKDSEQLSKSIEKMIDKNDENSELLFLGCMIKYTTAFNQIKRSTYSKRCDAFNNILEYVGQLFHLPTGIACFRKSLECIYKRKFSIEHRGFLFISDRCKNILTSAKIQHLCKKKTLSYVFI